jgi:diadenosine tetraphosphate (Ap4A) HIT family hydrolase
MISEGQLQLGNSTKGINGCIESLPLLPHLLFHQFNSADQAAVWDLISEVRTKLIERFRPDGFNVGFNDGLYAGQTVDHAHVHIIPRRASDVPDPRGGIR